MHARTQQMINGKMSTLSRHAHTDRNREKPSAQQKRPGKECNESTAGTHTHRRTNVNALASLHSNSWSGRSCFTDRLLCPCFSVLACSMRTCLRFAVFTLYLVYS